MKKKLLKPIICLIVVLLNCLNLYAQNDSPKGKINKSDSLITIDISYIRLANEKLLERNYLIEENKYKDSIILDYKNYIKEYENLHIQYNNKIKEYNRINNDLNKSLNKHKKLSLICGTATIVSVSIIVIICVIK